MESEEPSIYTSVEGYCLIQTKMSSEYKAYKAQHKLVFFSAE